MPIEYQGFAAAFPWFFPAAAALFGACIGSFLNVVIYRVPAGKSVVRPPSHCGCGQPIAWHDNIPVASWILLRGRARCCGRRFSFRYPFIELLTAALFLACALVFESPAKAVCGMIFLSALVAATFIDLDHFIIPDAFTIGLAVAGVLLSLLVPALHGHREGFFLIDSTRSVVDSIHGLLVGSAIVLWIGLIGEVLLKKEAMGFGDVKFVGAIGAFLGWPGAVATVFGGTIVGLVWIGLALLVRRISGNSAAVLKAETPEGEPVEIGRGVQVPFGPMLAVAAAIYFLGFDRYFLRYLATFRELM